MSEVGGKVPETTKPRIAGALDMVAPGVEKDPILLILKVLFMIVNNGIS